MRTHFFIVDISIDVPYFPPSTRPLPGYIFFLMVEFIMSGEIHYRHISPPSIIKIINKLLK